MYNPIVDQNTLASVHVDYAHHEIHEGDNFFYSRFHNVASGATLTFVLTAGSKAVHFVYSVDSDFAGFTMATYRNITHTAGSGTVLPILNNNTVIDTPSTAELRQDVTGLSTVGATLYRTASKGTAVNPAKTAAGSIGRTDEVILKPGEKWLLTITNKATAENPINIGMSWYEHNSN